ncbi:MAG: hypothetical protein HYR71_03735 [Chloroflexi bacterium]|nr:hypothetical protein [Chloroflexota bacterium]
MTEPSSEIMLVFPRDLLRFLYWLVLKPITFENYVRRFGVSPATSLITLWRRGKEQPALRQLVYLGLFHMIVMPWLLIGAGLLILSPFGLTVNGLGVAFGKVVGVAVGVLAGVTFGVMGAAVAGVLGGVTFGVTGAVMVGLVVGVAFGVWGVVANGAMSRGVLSFAVGVGGVVAYGVLSRVVSGLAVSVTYGVISGILVGGSFIVGYFRLWLYVIELPLTWLIAWRARRSQTPFALWRFMPVVWHEATWLPLWGLDRYLLTLAQSDREAGAKAIAFVAQSFRQQWAARNALAELSRAG